MFGMAAMPFLCNGILLTQCNLPTVLSVLVLKIASCLIPYVSIPMSNYCNCLIIELYLIINIVRLAVGKP